MTDQPPYIDLEAAVIELLTDLATCDVVTPSSLQHVVPFIRITRNGGPDDRITDTGHIDIDVFATARTAAKTLAELVRQRLESWPHSLSAGVIDRADCTNGPVVVPWANTNLSLVTLTFAVSARRTFAPV